MPDNVLDMAGRKLRIGVSFYNDAERDKLQLYPTSARISEIANNGIHVNWAQFLTYYLYHRRRPGKPGYRDYLELGQRIGHAVMDLDDWVELRDGSLVSAPDIAPQRSEVIEHVGEAAALCVMGEIHAIHDADWECIPIHRGRGGFPTFDFQRHTMTASDGAHLIQVEAKGTGVDDTGDMSASIRTHKADIDEKKAKIREREAAGTYLYPADLRYGVICALGFSGALTCWLTDPPGDAGDDPQRFRLLARLRFIFDWLSFLSSRSQLAASLATRLQSLYVLDDPFVLDKIRLFRGNGKEYEIVLDSIDGSYKTFGHLCRVVDGPAVGTLIKTSSGKLLFIGVQGMLFEMAASQDFGEIMKYKYQGGSVDKTVRCSIPRGRAKRMGIDHLDQSSDRTSGYVGFNAYGVLHYSHGGVVFGIVDPEDS